MNNYNIILSNYYNEIYEVVLTPICGKCLCKVEVLSIDNNEVSAFCNNCGSEYQYELNDDE